MPTWPKCVQRFSYCAVFKLCIHVILKRILCSLLSEKLKSILPPQISINLALNTLGICAKPLCKSKYAELNYTTIQCTRISRYLVYRPVLVVVWEGVGQAVRTLVAPAGVAGVVLLQGVPPPAPAVGPRTPGPDVHVVGPGAGQRGRAAAAATELPATSLPTYLFI